MVLNIFNFMLSESDCLACSISVLVELQSNIGRASLVADVDFLEYVILTM